GIAHEHSPAAPILPEDLHTVIAPIGHVDVAVVVHRDTAGAVELTLSLACGTVGRQEGPLLVIRSAPRCSSPTTAWAMACRMPGVGWVTVSLLRSIMLSGLLRCGNDEACLHAQCGCVQSRRPR